MNSNPENIPPENFSELIAEINHVSTKLAADRFNAGSSVSKMGVFAGSALSFAGGLFSGLRYDRLGRFYSAFYFSAVRFLTGLKLLKLQNRL